MTTLRDLAAVAAMEGLLCDGADRRTSGPLSTAQTAVEYADALLAELARTAPKTEPTAGACTAAERELIEADFTNASNPSNANWKRREAARDAVRAERRAAKGGEQP
mgnify:CR=1 FL=1